MINEVALDALGTRLAQDSMRLFVALNPGMRTTLVIDLDAPIAAMRAASKVAIGQLVDDVKAEPWHADLFFAAAVATIAQAGSAALNAEAQRGAA